MIELSGKFIDISANSRNIGKECIGEALPHKGAAQEYVGRIIQYNYGE